MVLDGAAAPGLAPSEESSRATSTTAASDLLTSRALASQNEPDAATKDGPKKKNCSSLASDETGMIVRDGVSKEIARGVLRKKLAKMRHLVIDGGISKPYLDSIFPSILDLFAPQSVTYNGGIAKIKDWKISCYLEVMEGGVPCTNPNLELLRSCTPLLDTCNDLFRIWYRQQHACNAKLSAAAGKENKDGGGGDGGGGENALKVERLMTFITRYTAAPGEQALLKHVDGAGKVDGSVVVALPIDRWSAPEEVNSFEGHGGGLTFWDGKSATGRPQEINYDTRSGDIAFIDRAVWHQANPITKGTRWALVIFYKVL